MNHADFMRAMALPSDAAQLVQLRSSVSVFLNEVESASYSLRQELNREITQRPQQVPVAQSSEVDLKRKG